jgi:hypothetical protein
MGCTFSIYYLTDHEEIKDKTRMYAFIFLGLVVYSFFLNVGQHYSFGAMGEYVTKRTRERMLEKVLTFEVGWFHGRTQQGGSQGERTPYARKVHGYPPSHHLPLERVFALETRTAPAALFVGS